MCGAAASIKLVTAPSEVAIGSRIASPVRESAGKNVSIASSDSAASKGVPNVIFVLRKDRTPPLVFNLIGTEISE